MELCQPAHSLVPLGRGDVCILQQTTMLRTMSTVMGLFVLTTETFDLVHVIKGKEYSAFGKSPFWLLPQKITEQLFVILRHKSFLMIKTKCLFSQDISSLCQKNPRYWYLFAAVSCDIWQEKQHVFYFKKLISKNVCLSLFNTARLSRGNSWVKMFGPVVETSPTYLSYWTI